MPLLWYVWMFLKGSRARYKNLFFPLNFKCKDIEGFSNMTLVYSPDKISFSFFSLLICDSTVQESELSIRMPVFIGQWRWYVCVLLCPDQQQWCYLVYVSSLPLYLHIPLHLCGHQCLHCCHHGQLWESKGKVFWKIVSLTCENQIVRFNDSNCI